jgi:hypothetical protein
MPEYRRFAPMRATTWLAPTPARSASRSSGSSDSRALCPLPSAHRPTRQSRHQGARRWVIFIVTACEKGGEGGATVSTWVPLIPSTNGEGEVGAKSEGEEGVDNTGEEVVGGGAGALGGIAPPRRPQGYVKPAHVGGAVLLQGSADGRHHRLPAIGLHRAG